MSEPSLDSGAGDNDNLLSDTSALFAKCLLEQPRVGPLDSPLLVGNHCLTSRDKVVRASVSSAPVSKVEPHSWSGD